MTEQQWIARARHGDADAFEQLVVAYEGPVYRLALRMCGSTEDAREVTQDAFLAACLVVVLGVYLVRYQVEKDSDSPFSGILPDSSANNSVGANEDTFSDEVTPSDGGLTFASGGTERQEPSDPADYVLIGCPELAQQARQWLSQQGLEPDEDGVYSLTAQQVQDLNAAVPELELPTDDALRLLLED